MYYFFMPRHQKNLVCNWSEKIDQKRDTLIYIYIYIYIYIFIYIYGSLVSPIGIALKMKFNLLYVKSRSSFLIKYWFKLLGLLFLSLFLLIILSVTLWANILYFICTEFLKRIKVSISHHTDTPDWKLISYISYIYIFSPTKNDHIC